MNPEHPTSADRRDRPDRRIRPNQPIDHPDRRQQIDRRMQSGRRAELRRTVHVDRPIQPGLISVIIPTFRRYDELRRAAESTIAQTHAQVEVLVVADGPDPAAREAVAGLGPRLRYYELPCNAGPAAARNFGIHQSHGEWLTFLDDDDTMQPDRLARQFQHLHPAEPWRMSACRITYCHGGRADVWPSRPIGPDEDLGDYLLVRPSLLGRPGVLSLQSLVIHHSIMAAVPLTTHADHEDWAWLLDAWHLAGARVEFLWESLATYNIDLDGISRSRRANWQDSLLWALQYRSVLSPRAFNSFLSTKVALKARRAGSLGGLCQILGLLAGNTPRPLDLLFFFAIALLPNSLSHLAWKKSLQRSMQRAPDPAPQPAAPPASGFAPPQPAVQSAIAFAQPQAMQSAIGFAPPQPAAPTPNSFAHPEPAL